MSNSDTYKQLPSNVRHGFGGEHSGRMFHYFKGAPDRFTHLLPWATSNELLTKYRLTPPRARLVYEGGNVRVDGYTYIYRERCGRSHRLLNLESVSNQLRRGATLVIDAVDELYEPIRSLSTEIERFLHEEVQINAYIAWGDTFGFPVHEDPHDALVFQVVGRKKWRVFVPNNEALIELETQMTEGSRTPEGNWECILEQGDVLYIPKGWRHEAEPLGEATIHLTAGIERRSGQDYLSWVLSNSKRLPIFQEAAPRFGDSDIRLAYQNRLKEALIGMFDLFPIDTYFEDCDAELRVRGQINLPWSACNALTIKPDATINWLLPFVTNGAPINEKEMYVVKAGGRTLNCQPNFMPILKQLELVQNISYGKLCAFAKSYEIKDSEVFKLIDQLSIHGWISITTDNL